MIPALITLLIVALVLLIIYHVAGMFIGGNILSLIGIILGLLFVLYALRTFNIGL